MVNWNLAKLQYEIFGLDEAQLAAAHCCEPGIIAYAIEERQWERKSNFADVRGGTKEEIIDALKAKSADLRVLKQDALNPMYIKLESILLEKATEIIAGLDAKDSDSVQAIKHVADSFTKLMEVNGANVMAGQDKDNKLVIAIQNNYGSPQEADNSGEVIEIEMKSG